MTWQNCSSSVGHTHEIPRVNEKVVSCYTAGWSRIVKFTALIPRAVIFRPRSRGTPEARKIQFMAVVMGWCFATLKVPGRVERSGVSNFWRHVIQKIDVFLIAFQSLDLCSQTIGKSKSFKLCESEIQTLKLIERWAYPERLQEYFWDDCPKAERQMWTSRQW
jgi:hypothetical protein